MTNIWSITCMCKPKYQSQADIIAAAFKFHVYLSNLEK